MPSSPFPSDIFLPSPSQHHSFSQQPLRPHSSPASSSFQAASALSKSTTAAVHQLAAAVRSMTVSGTSSPSPATPMVSTAAPLCPSRLEAQLRHLSSLSRPLRILAADDNAIHHRIIGQILRKQFPEVLGDIEFVSSGYVVLDYLAHHEYDLVLLDIDMPGLSGIETARLIRAGPSGSRDVPAVLPCNQDIPIIAVTSNSLDHHRQRYSEVGINDCVAKPVNARELRRAIDHVTSEASAIPVLASD